MRAPKWVSAFFCLSILLAVLFISGCENSVTDPSQMSDDEYLQTVAVQSTFSNNPNDEDNLFATEIEDFDSEGAVFDSEGAAPVDSLYKWGRRVTNVNVNTSITSLGDTAKKVDVIKTVSGNLIVMYFVGGVLDSVVKPYVHEHKRNVTFKKVGSSPNPRRNWRVYEISAVDGQTISPQTGKDNIVMNKIEIYKNGQLELTLNGPDFTSNVFTARHFGGPGILNALPGDQVQVKVYLTSNQADKDMVTFHWAKNRHGRHRVLFEMTSEVQNGSTYDRIFERTFDIYNLHRRGVSNGYIGAATRSTLFDSDPSLLSTTYAGMKYFVRPF